MLLGDLEMRTHDAVAGHFEVDPEQTGEANRPQRLQLREGEVHGRDPTLAAMSRKMFLVVLAVMVAVLALGFAVAPRIGWATPFALPHQLTFNGKTYYDGDAGVPEHFPCEARLGRGGAPLRPIGSIVGYLTTDKQLLLPHDERRYPYAYLLFIRNGACLQAHWDITDGP